jgi:glutamate/tyrosine decarboxylase-like PLP-dependent enzyme
MNFRQIERGTRAASSLRAVEPDARRAASILCLTMSNLLDDAAKRASRYLESLNARSVAPEEAAVAGLARFDQVFPDHSSSAESVLAELDEIGSPATMASAGARFFGFVTGGALPVTVAANWLATTWDQNAGLVVSSPANAALEKISLRWLKDIFHLPLQSGGGFVTSATAANFSALAAARHALLARAGWDVEAQGLFGAPLITVVVGNEVHASLLKALSMVGFGRDRVVRVPVDVEGRMRLDAFPEVDARTIVCVQAGNVNTGAFDPVAEICARAHSQGAWVHVDGAFGMWAAAAPARTHLARGIEQADSWATDAHKWLNVPYDSGLVFARDADALRKAMSIGGAYLAQDEDRVPYQYTPDFSRRARGIEIWAALRQLGRPGLADLIERTCRYAGQFAEVLRAAGHRVLNDVALNQVLVSFGSAERTLEVIDRVQRDGTCWCGGTVWQGHAAMRISVSSWATTEADVERSLAAILRIASY